MGYAKKETNRNPGGQMRKKKSEYGIQLNEKQKVKFIYGILEKQFHAYYEAAAKTPGKTGDNLLIAVERRLDNVVYRMGFAMTRRQARQLVSHAHFTVNGRKVDIPSYQVKAGDVIEVAESSRSSEIFKRLLGQDAPVFLIPAWMEREKNALKGTVTRLPPGRTSTFPSRSTSSLSCTPSKRRIPSIMIGTAGGAQSCVLATRR